MHKTDLKHIFTGFVNCRKVFKVLGMDKLYCCKNCGWMGEESKLDYDVVDTCMGDDKIETCPECGSYEVKTLMDGPKEN